MRKEPKPRKGTGFMNLLFLVVVVWIVWGLYQQGTFDRFLNNYVGHPFKSIEDTTCNDLKENAIGQKLSNDTSEKTTEVMGVRNIEEISRNKNELVCMGEVLTKGNYSTITITLSDWDGELFVQWQIF